MTKIYTIFLFEYLSISGNGIFQKNMQNIHKYMKLSNKIYLTTNEISVANEKTIDSFLNKLTKGLNMTEQLNMEQQPKVFYLRDIENYVTKINDLPDGEGKDLLVESLAEAFSLAAENNGEVLGDQLEATTLDILLQMEMRFK